MYQFVGRKLDPAGRPDCDYDESVLNLFAADGWRVVYVEPACILLEKEVADE